MEKLKSLLTRPGYQLPLALLVGPMLLIRGCAASCDARTLEREREAQAQQMQELKAAREQRELDRLAEIDRREKEVAEERRRLEEEERRRTEQIETAKIYKPHERIQALVSCAQQEQCPIPAETLLSTTRSEAESESFRKHYERAERAFQRGIAPLLCRDGTTSPTCTCGGPRRGCCSHHGGVAGCSADR